MKSMTITLACLVIAISAWFANAQDETPSATVDFSSLNKIPGIGKRGVRLIVKTVDGTVSNPCVVFDAGQDVAEGACIVFFGSMEDTGAGTGWIMDRKNTRLTIVGFKGKTGRVSPIKEIRVTSEGEFALEYVPMITTTGKVKIERDVRPSQPK